MLQQHEIREADGQINRGYPWINPGSFPAGALETQIQATLGRGCHATCMVDDTDPGYAAFNRLTASPDGGQRRPLITDPVCHSLTMYRGTYYPIAVVPSTGMWQIVGEPSTCVHCAFTVAKAWMDALPQTGHYRRCATLAVGAPRYRPEQSYLPPRPPAGEVAGEVVNENGVTIRSPWTDARSCATCGLIGHNARTCTSEGKAHLKIGIEIEGRWLDLVAVQNRAEAFEASYTTDGSIRRSGSAARPYEIQSHPGSLAHQLNQLHAMYPDEADKSCGMHIHVSFNPHDVAYLNTKAFYAYFKAEWTTWGREAGIPADSEFWVRLEGENEYCAPNHDEYRDYDAMRNAPRYQQLNFSAWAEHKTVECRLLPMFRHESLARSAVCKLIDIYESWLMRMVPEILTVAAAIETAKAPAPPLYGTIIEASVADVDDTLTDLTFGSFPVADIVLPELNPATDRRIPACSLRRLVENNQLERLLEAA